ncbi:hypothetical protein BKH28_09200 [Actinomyces oris]|uniref:Uncharacterized protein n=1 Tax=Actinomyces oris TaxID=544580 RepID=A0A1Q8VKQ9_9ACTO|nr:hypothetical protein BKH28_09200 [Actinomyces oris]
MCVASVFGLGGEGEETHLRVADVFDQFSLIQLLEPMAKLLQRAFVCRILRTAIRKSIKRGRKPALFVFGCPKVYGNPNCPSERIIEFEGKRVDRLSKNIQ